MRDSGAAQGGGPQRAGVQRAGARRGDLPGGGARAKQSEALRAGDLIRSVVKTHGLDTQGKLDRLSAVWRELVGQATAKQTRIVALKGSVLTVEAANSALAQELSVYLKRDLLSQLQSELGIKLSDLRCRVGGWSEE